MASMSRWADRVVTVGAVALLVAGPLAFGSVHRIAFVTLEIITFAMVAAWGLKIWSEAPASTRLAVEGHECRRVAVPAFTLTALLALQLIPLPPRIMHTLSPVTYHVYQVSFPGWPIRSPYQSLAPLWGDITAVPRTAAMHRMVAGLPTTAMRLHWRTLALAPTVTASSLIEWTALVALFSIVVLYPFGLVGESRAELRFYRVVAFTVLAMAVTLAVIGLAQLAWWNGKLLWFYVPADWGKPMIGVPVRASGPFVDPDHFADYLAMVLPTAIAAALFPSHLVPREHRVNLQVIAMLASLVIALAIALSLSRAGWTAAAVGTAVAVALAATRSLSVTQVPRRSFGACRTIFATAGAMAMLAVVLYGAGPLGRAMMANRVGDTMAVDVSVAHRMTASSDTLKMVADFPFFGVGLGSWPDLFPHYRRPPWTAFFSRQIGNDYIQFVAETGVLGLALALWLSVALVNEMRRGASFIPGREWPLFAGLCGGVVAILIHELFDFSLRTPANAFLFVIILATALRLALTHLSRSRARIATRGTRLTHLTAAAMGFAAMVSVAIAASQDGSAYPYDIGGTGKLSEAEVTLIEHPAVAAAHLHFLDLSNRQAPPGLLTKLIDAAVWLDPNSPEARDAYARILLLAGHKSEGLGAVAVSVYRAPQLRVHPYLAPPLIPWLLPDEQAAVAAGFKRAVKEHFPGAVTELVAFYDTLGRYADSAQLYEREAEDATDSDDQLGYFVLAGRKYALAGDPADAARALQKAIDLSPAAAQPYVELARSVYGPSGQMAKLRSLLDAGKSAGADPYELDLALADGAELANDRAAATTALTEALRYRPTFETTMRLGGLYLAGKDFPKAVVTFTRAVDLNPDAPAAWSALGEAEESQYDYAAAERAYARAHLLAPRDARLARVYTDFERRTRTSGEFSP